MRNPYPESVFPPMDLGEASLALQQAGISPDRVFGNWGREVWDNCYQDTLKEVGEWLNKHWTVTEGNHLKDARFANVVIGKLLQGKMPEEVKDGITD